MKTNDVRMEDAVAVSRPEYCADGRVFGGWIHIPTWRRFRSLERATEYGIKWGRTAGSGPNMIVRVESASTAHGVNLPVCVETINLPWK